MASPKVTRGVGGLPISLAIGAVAGFVGSCILVTSKSDSLLTSAVVYLGSTFVAGATAILFAPSRYLEVWGLVTTGIALGVVGSLFPFPAIHGGERNLWPFEVAIYCVVGLPPIWIGMWVSQRLIQRRTERGSRHAT